jgi:hypothetical protein
MTGGGGLSSDAGFNSQTSEIPSPDIDMEISPVSGSDLRLATSTGPETYKESKIGPGSTGSSPNTFIRSAASTPKPTLITSQSNVDRTSDVSSDTFFSGPSLPEENRFLRNIGEKQHLDIFDSPSPHDSSPPLQDVDNSQGDTLQSIRPLGDIPNYNSFSHDAGDSQNGLDSDLSVSHSHSMRHSAGDTSKPALNTHRISGPSPSVTDGNVSLRSSELFYCRPKPEFFLTIKNTIAASLYMITISAVHRELLLSSSNCRSALTVLAVAMASRLVNINNKTLRPLRDHVANIKETISGDASHGPLTKWFSLNIDTYIHFRDPRVMELTEILLTTINTSYDPTLVDLAAILDALDAIPVEPSSAVIKQVLDEFPSGNVAGNANSESFFDSIRCQNLYRQIARLPNSLGSSSVPRNGWEKSTSSAAARKTASNTKDGASAAVKKKSSSDTKDLGSGASRKALSTEINAHVTREKLGKFLIYLSSRILIIRIPIFSAEFES